ncbi:F-BAR and double SH3 domains protein 1-like [Salmo trutta]|uniref:F-BAR and double SH3 domains protein 1-like n=1 Tax=Salmo trutta TaxID=8032 RepID=UPI0011307A76|nr:F-BAR and double SH3 domains protein 1-like [Salmo trutta]
MSKSENTSLSCAAQRSTPAGQRIVTLARSARTPPRCLENRTSRSSSRSSRSSPERRLSLPVAPKDKVCILKQHSSSAEGESCLDKEARKWSAKAAKDYKIISHGDRALQMLDRRFKLLSGDTGVSVEQKMVEVKEM